LEEAEEEVVVAAEEEAAVAEEAVEEEAVGVGEEGRPRSCRWYRRSPCLLPRRLGQ
jgi:hypothetical protein